MSNLLLAYIDPGSGFIILQAIVAAIVGSAVFFRRMIYKSLCLIFGRGKTAGAPPSTVPAEPISAPVGDNDGSVVDHQSSDG